MKRILSAILAVAMTLSICVFNVSASNKIAFSASAATGDKGGEVDVTIDIANNTAGVGGIELQLTFDKNVLEVVSATKTNTLAGGMVAITGVSNANANGYIKYTCAAMDNIAGDGTLVNVKFKIKDGAAYGDSTLTLTMTNLANYVGGVATPISADDYTVANGKVTVACTSHTPATDWEIVANPDCTTPGSKVLKCTKCGAVVDTKSIDALDHQWSDWGVTTPATCTVAGEESRHCNRCDAHEERDIDATGHDWSNWDVTSEPTLETKGEAERVCGNDSSHVETVELLKNTLKMTDEKTGATLEIQDPTEDTEFSGTDEFTVLDWEDVFDMLLEEGLIDEEDVTEIKADLAEFDKLVKEAAGNDVINRYMAAISDEYGIYGYGDDVDEDAKFIMTIPLNETLQKATNLKLYGLDFDANDPAVKEIAFTLSDDGKSAIIDVTDEMLDISIPYLAFAGETPVVPVPGTGVVFSVSAFAVLAVAAAAAFVFARKKAVKD